MPSEVTTLRKSGNLQGAYELGLRNFEANPTDVWAKRDLGWVYFEYLKENINNVQIFVNVLKAFSALDMDINTEDMIFLNIYRQIYKFIQAYEEYNSLSDNIALLTELFTILSNFEKKINPVGLMSLNEARFWLGKSIHVALKEDKDSYITFIDWFKLENLGGKSFEEYKTEEGKTLMSQGEQMIHRYLKKLIEQDKQNLLMEPDHDRIVHLINYLEKNIVVRKKEFHKKWNNYWLAQLYKTLGNNEKALYHLKQFVRENETFSWAWEKLTYFYEENQDIIFAFLCKGASTNEPNSLKGKIFEQLIPFFLEKNEFDIAKTLVNTYLESREENWTSKEEISILRNASWFETAKKINLNKVLLENSKAAMDYIFNDVPEFPILVTHINRERNIINFVFEKKTNEYGKGFFKLPRGSRLPQIDKVYLAKLHNQDDGERFKCISLSKNKLNQETPFIREFEGVLEIQSGNSFGFIRSTKDIFISPALVKLHKLSEKFDSKPLKLTLTAKIDFNRKKNSWGWSAIEINHTEVLTHG